MKKYILLILFLLSFASSAHADEYRPAYLEFKQIGDSDFKMLWKVPAKGQNRRLSLYVILPEDITQKTNPVGVFYGGAYIERSIISRQGGLAGTKIAIKGLQKVSTDVLVRIQRLDGTTETARLNASSTSFVIKGALQFWDVVNTYLVFGIEHILNGFDHLLFIACLMFIAGTWRRILITITGFTLAHSITLTLAALDMVRLPIPPIEATIALSIVFLAREIALDRRDTLTWRFPIVVSSSFGLLHGFGFASALRDIGLPQTELPAALLAFNIGVEIGQVLFVAAVLLIFQLIILSVKAVQTEPADKLKMIEKPIIYGIGTVAMFWTVERITGFLM